MTKSRSITLKLLAPIALMALSACATPFKADVSRFQAMPAPSGQTFYIQPADPKNEGGLEFANYAKLVGQKLEGIGYRAAPDAKEASLVVSLDYGVDKGIEKIRTWPRSYMGMGYGFGPGWGSGFGRYPYWGPYPYYHGWYDPFWNDPWDYQEVESYTEFTSFLDLKISRTTDGDRVFEGVAKAHSTNDKLTQLVPNLVEAMFTNFPGNSGEEIKITVPPPAKGK